MNCAFFQNKKTYLLTTALNTATGKEREALLNLLTELDEEKKIDGVKKAFDELGVKAATEIRINNFYDKSISSLQAIDIDAERKKPLFTLAQMVHERDF